MDPPSNEEDEVKRTQNDRAIAQALAEELAIQAAEEEAASWEARDKRRGGTYTATVKTPKDPPEKPPRNNK